MIIAIGSDHGGFKLKQEVIQYLKELGHEVKDEGTYSLDSCDYPDFAHKVATDVSNNIAERGIVICTTGEGIMIASNKHKGVRCGLIYNEDVAALTRQHNNVNMISMGAKYTSIEQAKKYIDLFLNTPFEGGRHINRVNKIEL